MSMLSKASHNHGWLRGARVDEDGKTSHFRITTNVNKIKEPKKKKLYKKIWRWEDEVVQQKNYDIHALKTIG